MRYPVGVTGSREEFKKYWYLAQRFNSPPGHDGVDINLQTGGNTDLGEPLYAIADGRIVYLHDDHPDTLFGLHFAIEIVGPWGVRWAHYAHCDPKDFPTGSPPAVKEGEMIARLGKTGTYHAHLHFSIIKVDPFTIGGIDAVANTYKQLIASWEDPVKFVQKWIGEIPPQPADHLVITDETIIPQIGGMRVREIRAQLDNLDSKLAQIREITRN